MPVPIHTPAHLTSASIAVALGLAIAACGGDGPSGPSEDFDIVGQWQWRVNNATGSGMTCTVTGVTLTFSRSDGILSGTRFSSGGGNLVCTAGSASSTGDFTTNSTLKQLTHTGTSIGFEFDTIRGAWVMTGSITNDNSMGGTATIRVNSPTGTVAALTGPWTATRD